MDKFQQLKELLLSTERDYYKSLKGNQAAGLRLRKNLQDIKRQSSEIRIDSLILFKSAE